MCCIDGTADRELSSARYCSRECQRQDWPNHKLACARMAASRQKMCLPENVDFRKNNAMLSRWMDIWNRVVGSFCLLGMDLVNHPDRLRTHV